MQCLHLSVLTLVCILGCGFVGRHPRGSIICLLIFASNRSRFWLCCRSCLQPSLRSRSGSGSSCLGQASRCSTLVVFACIQFAEPYCAEDLCVRFCHRCAHLSVFLCRRRSPFTPHSATRPTCAAHVRQTRASARRLCPLDCANRSKFGLI